MIIKHVLGDIEASVAGRNIAWQLKLRISSTILDFKFEKGNRYGEFW